MLAARTRQGCWRKSSVAGSRPCRSHIPSASSAFRCSISVACALGSACAREGLRYRAVGQIQTGLARELGDEELAIDGGGDLLFAIHSAPDRREVERHGELLAAEVTARLCGTLPGGAIVRVTTLPFDPTTELVGATTAEIAASLARRLDPTATADQATTERRGAVALRPRFGPLLHLRKRLVSAYRLETADGSDVSELHPAETDAWALELVAGQLRGATHGRPGPRGPGAFRHPDRHSGP